jgi:hypothetical protein
MTLSDLIMLLPWKFDFLGALMTKLFVIALWLLDNRTCMLSFATILPFLKFYEHNWNHVYSILGHTSEHVLSKLSAQLELSKF